MSTLRAYQQHDVERITESMRRTRRVLYVLPTGGGKTTVFTHIGQKAAAKGRRTLILAHRHELIKQISRRLEMPHGIIAPGFTPYYELPIQVGMIQTVARRPVGGFDLIIPDEAHHTPSNTYRKVLDASPNAWKLGVTATPQRGDGRGLGELFDEMVLGPTAAELTEQGYLAPAIVYAPSTINTSGIKRARGDYDNRSLTQLSDTPTVTGCAVSHYKKHADGRRALVTACSVDHAYHVAQQFCDAGYRFKAVHGKMTQYERDEAIDGLTGLRYHGLVYCDLFSEGVDVPVVEVGIFLRKTLSLGLWDQQVGRILRPFEGKSHALLLDHVGNTAMHGIAPWGREWSLEGEAPRRGLNAEEKRMATRTCPTCFGIHPPAPQCPYCGEVYVVQGRTPEQVAGELVEVSPAEIARRKAHVQHVLRAASERFERRFG